MASAAYWRWIAAGKPLSPSTPVREFVLAMQAAFPRAAAINLINWYTNDAHLTAEPPEDHTPFSETDWPDVLESPPDWLVFATDIMHRPDLGLDCGALFLYWITEARDGRMPFLKYLNWQALRYDVRNGWRPVPTTGHFDHIHLSFRTDWRTRGLEGWPVIPMGGLDMTALTDAEQRELLDGIREVRSLLTTGKRLGPAQTSDGGVPIADEQRQFYDLDNALTDVKTLLSSVASAVADLQDNPPAAGLSADQVREIVRTELDDTVIERAELAPRAVIAPTARTTPDDSTIAPA